MRITGRIRTVATLATALCCLLLADCGAPTPAPAPKASVTPAPSAPASINYVGAAVCSECHADAAKAWRGSHHDLAMQDAISDSVLGDFGDARFQHAGIA